jgi:hypothetical protein
MSLERRPIRQRLAEFCTEAELDLWIYRWHPQLGCTPAQAVDSGRADEVHRIIDRMDEGAYL